VNSISLHTTNTKGINIIQNFFQKIAGNDKINFNAIRGTQYQKYVGHFTNVTAESFKCLNNRNYEIYFVVNTGGYKKKEITKINAVFIDLDCGKDSNNDYYPMNIVKQYKEQKMAELTNFAFKPSYVIETRNGLHAYWLVDNSTIEQFEECQVKLIEYFSADKQCKNINRLMRVPGFYWCKNPQEKFLTRITVCNNIRYKITDLIKSLPDIPPISKESKSQPVLDTHNNNNNVSKVTIKGNKNPSWQENNIQLIRNRDTEALKKLISPEPQQVNNNDEVFSQLKRKNLMHYLGLPSKFNCLFHRDRHPSANIFIDPLTGYYWYKCHSESCGVKANIISITERLLQGDLADALRFLRQVYCIDYIETDWQREKRLALETNIKLLQDNDSLKLIAPEAYSRVNYYLNLLISLHYFAIDKVTTENFTDKYGNPLFYASLQYLGGKCNQGDVKKFGQRIGLLAYMGFINKLSDSDIPEFLLVSSIGQAKRQKQVNRIGYYSIPSYTGEVLAFAESKALEYKEKGFTMRGWGRELLLRTLGEEEADRVYPQQKGKSITALNGEMASQMEQITMQLVNDKGWTTESEIIENLTLKFKGQRRYKNQQIKRILPELLEKYELKRVRLNKELKAEFGISVKGYPFIIVA